MTKPEIIQPGHYDEDQEEGRLVANPDIQALTQLSSAEISQQILTARAYPRSITSFRRSMREMVTYDEAVAKSCLYALRRGNKTIEGASIRFAESAIQAWGNARVGSRIVDIGEEFITAQGFFYDLERNMALAFEVMRRITDKEGNRYGEDMIGVTGNAAASIALRNAILRGIPKIAWDESYQAARLCSIGKFESISAKREEMLKAFVPFGVDQQQIFGLLGVKGIDDVTVDNLMFLAGIHNSIKEGEQNPEEVFAVENMKNPDEVVPPRPRQSEFARSGAKPEAKPEPKPKDDKPAAAAKPAAEAKPADEAAIRAEETKEWIADAYKELAATALVRDIPELEERIASAGVMDQAGESAWRNACEAKRKEIMAKAKKK